MDSILIHCRGSLFGSMPSEFNTTFNSDFGLMRAPVARTCGNVLEPSEEYDRYQEFNRELLNAICFWNAIEMTILTLNIKVHSFVTRT